ncbi:hypothetical protein BGX26_001713 [Mortierella sp. AD094]|nr:hypothetical protein BGX26_001713 [Mortierella sp. AD094]
MVTFCQPGPRRYTLCGVPITSELLLRLLLLLVTIGALVAAAKPKITSILQQANVVGVTITDEQVIPAPSMLICSPFLDTVQVQGIIRGNGASIPDRIVNISSSTYTVVDITTLKLRDTGDWPTEGQCLKLLPNGTINFGQDTIGSTSNTILDTISISLMSKTNITAVNRFGLFISMWDGNVNITDALPIGNSIPSLNFITFVYSEHVPLHGLKDTRYTMTKQNLRTMNPGYFSGLVYATINFSPDTFYVSRFLDRSSYTWVDLAGAIGGLASIALAVWIFLFGSGKYKSWGIMQRYVLRTSPDSKKDRDGEAPRTITQRIGQFFRRVMSHFDSSTDNEIDSLPLQSAAAARRRQSARYSTPINVNAAGGAAILAAGSGKGVKTNAMSQSGEGYDPRHSSEFYGQSNYYFSDQGAPGSYSLRPLAPIGEGEDDAEEQVSELIRLIDLRIDERMWSLEKTLSRYYLDGFRLRNYSFLGGGGDQFYFSKDMEASANTLEYGRNSLQQNFDPNQPVPRTPTSPTYPPRPQSNQQYEVIDQLPSSQAPPVPRASRPSIPEATSSSTLSPPPSGGQLSPGFPPRRDMRGTIRRAVERLQNEWPQSHSPESYVPRTQYQSRDNNRNSTVPAPSGYSSVNINPTDGGDNSPPAY